MSEAPARPGLFASLRRMLATLLELGSTRLELVSIELQEQIEHAAGVLLWGVAAIFFAALTVLLVAFTIVIAFWDQHRLLVACLVTGAFASIALTAVVVVRRRLRTRPRFLAATAEELKRDAAALATPE